MEIDLIAAIGRERQLARQDTIPFFHPQDMAHFKQLTTGHILIMGRKTMQSLPYALENRTNVFLSRKPISREGFIHRFSLESALEYAQQRKCKKCFIIGGAELYSQTLNMSHTLYLSIFDYDGPADVYFPEYSHMDWNIRSQKSFPAFDNFPSFTLYIMNRI